MRTFTDPPDPQARLRGLFEESYADLLRFVQRRVPHSEAEDVVADTFLVAWRRLAEVPPDADGARAWLFGVARRSLLNNQRGRQRQQSLAVRIAQHPPAADREDLAAVDCRMQLVAAWPQLSPTDQETLALVAWDGLTSTEAATVLGISAVAFRLRLSRARRTLRRHLGAPAPTAAKAHAARPAASPGPARPAPTPVPDSNEGHLR